MKTQILSGSDESHLDLFVCTLKSGQPIAVPTETVYGLAAPVNDIKALKRIFEIKGRPLNDPLILHIADPNWLSNWAVDFDQDTVMRLAHAFWPGPLTLVLKKGAAIPGLATANLPTAGFRMPRHPDFLNIIKSCGVPLAAPSANPFTYISPTRPEHVARTLGGRIPIVVDGGPCEEGIESTILDLTDLEQPKILRPGPISAEAISLVLGQRAVDSASEHPQKVKSPGSFDKHYAPQKPISKIARTEIQKAEPGDALVFCGSAENALNALDLKVICLAESTDTVAVRKQLYAVLNALDDDERIGQIFLVDWPDSFQDAGLDDRIRRALN